MSGFRRALLCELDLARPGLVRLVAALAFVSLMISTSTGSASVLAACVFVTLAGSLAVQAAASDDAPGWAAARLCAGVSRRDVVLARYAFVFGAAAVGSVAACALGLALSLAGVPALGFIAATLPSAATVACLALGLLATAVLVGALVPCAFRWGMQGAVRYLPFALCLLVVIPLSTGLWHVIDDPAFVDGALAWAAVDANVLASAGSLALLAGVVTAVSVAVSLRVYARRDL